MRISQVQFMTSRTVMGWRIVQITLMDSHYFSSYRMLVMAGGEGVEERLYFNTFYQKIRSDVSLHLQICNINGVIIIYFETRTSFLTVPGYSKTILKIQDDCSSPVTIPGSQ